MTLPVSGTISMSQVSTELGRASTATTSLGESAVRTLAGVASGAIAFTNLHGKANFTMVDPNAGGTADSDVISPTTASIYMGCNSDGNYFFGGLGVAESPNAPGYWGSPIGSGAAGKYWRWNYVSGTSPNSTNMTEGLWYPVGGTYYVGFIRSTNGSTSGTFSIQTANDASGTGATTAGNWTLTALRSNA